MKRFHCILLAGLAILCFSTPTVWAGTYHSPMGYAIDLPEGWSMLNRDNVRDKPEMVDAAAGAAQSQQDFRGIPSRIVTRVKELLAGGRIEYFYSPEPRFSVSVAREPGKIPEHGFDADAICKDLAQELSEQNQREMRVYDCSPVAVDGRPALRLEADDYWKDRKYIQYLVRAGSEDVLVFTANTREKNEEAMKQEFEEIMGTVIID